MESSASASAAGVRLPGGSQVYGTFTAERGNDRLRQVALVAASLCVTAALIALLGSATQEGGQQTELGESRALSIASSYFTNGGERKDQARRRIAGLAIEHRARTMSLSLSDFVAQDDKAKAPAQTSAASSLKALERALMPANGEKLDAAKPAVAEAAKVVEPVHVAAAVIKPAVVVHHVEAEAPVKGSKLASADTSKSPLKGVAEGNKWYWHDKAVPNEGDAEKTVKQPEHIDIADDDVRVKVESIPKGQALAEETPEAKAKQSKLASLLHEHPAMIADPFSDVKLKGAQPGSATLWFN